MKFKFTQNDVSELNLLRNCAV